MYYNTVHLFGYIGSGINHLRWLILLSDSYEILGNINITDKVKFIKESVYNKDKNFQTWIRLEWRLRDALKNNIVQFDHNTRSDYLNLVNDKVIFLDREPIACLRHYFKLNSKLEGVISRHFIASALENSIFLKQQLPKCLVLAANFLDKEELDITTLSTIENYLNIKIPYEEASIIHRIWYIRNKQAEKQFLKTVNWLYERES
jgi:hypothetical protein